MPYQSSTSAYSLDDCHAGKLRELRQLLQLGGANAQPAPDKYLRRIRDIRFKDFADVVCKVLAVEDGGSTDICIFVWDGTDALPHAFR